MERLVKLAEAARSADTEAQLKLERAEEVGRTAEEQCATLRAKLLAAEGAVRSKDKELEKASRMLEATRSAENQTTAQALLTEVRDGGAGGLGAHGDPNIPF